MKQPVSFFNIRKKAIRYSIYVVVGISCLTFILPILWSIYMSFLPKEEILGLSLLPKGFTLNNYLEIFRLPQFTNTLKNSFVVSFVTTVVSLAIGGITAYALTRLPRTGGGHTALFILVFRMLPTIILIIPSFILLKRLDLLDTQMALIALYLTFSLPFAIWTLRGFLHNIPHDIDEAAMVDGCSRLGVFWRIIVPSMRSGILATGVIIFTFCWNDFLISLVLTSEESLTFLPYLTRFILPNETLYGQIFAGSVFFIVPILFMQILMRRYISESFGLGLIS